VVRDCPKGLYREQYVAVTEKTAISCLPCPIGWTTVNISTPAIGLCNRECWTLQTCVAHSQARHAITLLVMLVRVGRKQFAASRVQARTDSLHQYCGIIITVPAILQSVVLQL